MTFVVLTVYMIAVLGLKAVAVQLAGEAVTAGCRVVGRSRAHSVNLLQPSCHSSPLPSRRAILSDPFGTDAVDFELEAFMSGAMSNSIAKLTDRHVPWCVAPMRVIAHVRGQNAHLPV